MNIVDMAQNDTKCRYFIIWNRHLEVTQPTESQREDERIPSPCTTRIQTEALILVLWYFRRKVTEVEERMRRCQVKGGIMKSIIKALKLHAKKIKVRSVILISPSVPHLYPPTHIWNPESGIICHFVNILLFWQKSRAKVSTNKHCIHPYKCESYFLHLQETIFMYQWWFQFGVKGGRASEGNDLWTSTAATLIHSHTPGKSLKAWRAPNPTWTVLFFSIHIYL